MIKNKNEIAKAKLKNQYKAELNYCKILYSNKWDFKVCIESKNESLPSTIIKNMRNTLKGRGFNPDSYSYLFVPGKGYIAGYIALFDRTAEEFLKALQTIKNVNVVQTALDKNEPLETMLDIMQDYRQSHKNDKTYYFSKNTLKNNDFMQSILDVFVEEYAENLKSKNSNGTTYPNHIEHMGRIAKKQITFYPNINQQGNGNIMFLAKEYKQNKLYRQQIIRCNLSNYEIIPYLHSGKEKKLYYSKVTSNVPFVYMVIDKSNQKVVYVGETENAESRIKRHIKPSEKDSFEAFKQKGINNKKVKNNSVVVGYDFWKKYGNLGVTRENVKLFKNHKTPTKEYDFKLLPLTNYKLAYKNKVKNYMCLAEGFVMNQLELETPGRIIYADADMQFFNRTIIAYGEPLFYCSAEKDKNTVWKNQNRNVTESILNKHSDIVNKSDFRKMLVSTLEFVTGQYNISNNTMYDIFANYGLSIEQALRYAVGLPINKTNSDVEHSEYYIYHEELVDQLLKIIGVEV